jgi:hypothetical protein
MSQLGWMLTALVLFLVSLPVLSVGTTTETVVVWVIGLMLVILAGLIPPALRYLPLAQEEGGDGNGSGEEPGASGSHAAS